MIPLYGLAFASFWAISTGAADWLRARGQDADLAAVTALALVGLVGYVAFYAYLLAHPAGVVLSIGFVGAAVAAAGRRLFGARRMPPDTELTAAFQAAALFGALYLGLLLLYGGDGFSDLPGTVFFERIRPGDDQIPGLFAAAVYRHLANLVGEQDWGWHFSDRPPLQTGLVLLFLPFGRHLAPLAVPQGVGTAAQLLALVALLVFCRAVGCTMRERWLVLLAVGGSGFFYYNSVYVWPKLLAAAFFFCAATPLLKARLERRPLGAAPAAALGLAAALAMLSHGGVAFSLLALAPWAVLLPRPRLTAVRLAAAAAVACAVYSPWVIYASAFDPSGGKLLKLHLTDGDPDSPQPLSTMLAQSYGRLSPAEWGERRLDNLAVLFGSARIDRLVAVTLQRVAGAVAPPLAPGDFADTSAVDATRLGGDRHSLGAILRIEQREYLFPALGVLNLAWPVLLVAGAWRSARRLAGRSVPRAARVFDGALSALFALAVLTILAWCAIEFHGGWTVLTNGSYAMVLLLFVVAALLIVRIAPSWVRPVWGAHLAAGCVVWVLLMPGPLAAGAAPPPHLRVLPLLVVVLAGVALWRLLRRRLGAG